MADLYASYADLAAHEQQGVEYDIRAVRRSGTSWASIAIHGGGIEPGTSEVAEAVAGTSMRFYEFDAHVTSGSNTDLHVTSANFDEPQCLAMVTSSDRCLSFHGFTGTTGVAETLIGGNDVSLRDRVMRALQAAGFTVTVASSEFPGVDPANICNRTRLGGGVQLEMSRTLRESFFTDFTRNGRKNPANRTTAFNSYVAAILSVTGLRGGMVSMGSANVSRWTLLPGSDDVDQVVTFATDRLAAGGPQYIALVGRWADASNCYLARVELGTAQDVILTLRRRQAGADTVLGTYTAPLTHAAGGFLSVRLQMAKTVLRASVWTGSSQPADWQLTATDSAFTSGQMGIRYILSSTYTGTLPVTATVRGYTATPLPTIQVASTLANGPWTTDLGDLPLDIRVGGERMTVALITPTVADTFTRSTSGWGTADTGQAWTTSGGSPSDYTTDTARGVISQGTVGVLRTALLDVGGPDQTFEIDSPLVPTPTGAANTYWLLGRVIDANNHYLTRLDIAPGGGTQLLIYKRGGGSLTLIAGPLNVSPNIGGTWRLGLSVSGTTGLALLRAKAYRLGVESDPGWILSGTDNGALSTANTATQIGVGARLESGSTSTLPVLARWDNLAVSNPQKVTLSARGVNGVTRAWPAGTDVDVWAPAIASL